MSKAREITICHAVCHALRPKQVLGTFEIEIPKAVFKYNSSCTDFKIFEVTHIADVFVLFWLRVWIVKVLLLIFFVSFFL